MTYRHNLSVFTKLPPAPLATYSRTVYRLPWSPWGHVLTNFEAAYFYRRDIAQAIARYSASLRTIFKAHGSPIPPSPDCACAMGNAWALCRVDFYKADQRLALARLDEFTTRNDA
jgi:hypothetical protein